MKRNNLQFSGDIHTPAKNQKGMALIAVIFILVALGGIGMAVSKISGNQAGDAENAIQVQNAHYAANAGIDWAWQQRLDPASPLNTLAADYNSGLKTIPGGTNTFTVTYTKASDTLMSTAGKGSTSRVMVFNTFSTAVTIPGGGGGGGGPNGACTVVTAPNGVQTLMQQATAAGANGIKQNTPLAPMTMPTVAGATGTGITYSGARTYIGTNTLPAAGSNVNFINFTGSFRLSNNATLTINGPTTAGSVLTVFMGAGSLWDNNSTLNINGNVRIVTTGTVQMENGLHINLGATGKLLMMSTSTVTVENGAVLNNAPSASASNMLIMSQGLVDLQNSSVTNAGVYSTNSIRINNATTAKGAFVSSGAVSVSNSVVTPITGTANSVLNNVPVC